MKLTRLSPPGAASSTGRALSNARRFSAVATAKWSAIARGGGFQCEQMVGWQTCHRKSTAKAQVKFLREAFVLTRDRPFAVNRIAVQFS